MLVEAFELFLGKFWPIIITFSFLQLIMPTLENLVFPQSMEQRKEKFKCIDNPIIRKLMLDYMLDLLIVPYG